MPIEAEGVYPHCPTIVRHVELGGLTRAELIQRLGRHAISINAYGDRLLADVTLSEPCYQLETVELRTCDLGFPAGATTAELFERAGKLGLSLCPLEVGPSLRLQYLEQPQGFWIVIASPKPYEDPDAPVGFYLRRLDDGLWLRGYTAGPEHRWDAEDHFVFCKPIR